MEYSVRFSMEFNYKKEIFYLYYFCLKIKYSGTIQWNGGTMAQFNIGWWYSSKCGFNFFFFRK